MCDMLEREIQEDWVERGRSKLAGTLKKNGLKKEQKAPMRNCFNFCDDTMRKRTDVIMIFG